ncbi:hypothetical protein H8E88_16630 [candidate division KSB1 bacterium]|nr:hypothetical protein [candidate division KSB1 bacterium]
MSKNLVEGKKWNWELSANEKKAIAWFCGLIGLLAWAGFSTPNTIHVAIHFTRNINLFGMLYSGVVMGVIVGLIISIAEIVFIYLAVWKNAYFWIVVFLCGVVSVIGTVKFQDIGNQQAQIKKSEIENSKSLVENMEASIDTDRRLIEDYDMKIQAHRARGEKVPTWLYYRKRQAVERKSQKEIRLAALTNSYTETQKKIGAVITIGNGKNSYWGAGLAIFIECLIIACTVITIGIKISESASENNGQLVDMNGNRHSLFVNNKGNLKTTEKVTQNIGFKIGENVGNGVNVDRKMSTTCQLRPQPECQPEAQPECQPTCQPAVDGRTKRRLLNLVDRSGGKSDPVILHFWDRGVDNKAEIGRLVGTVLDYTVSRQYVSKVIQKREGGCRSWIENFQK